MAGELNGIFQWVEMLNEVNVEGVPAMTSVVAQKLKWREDEVTDGDVADGLMRNAPEREENSSSCPRWWNEPAILVRFYPGRGARCPEGQEDFLARIDRRAVQRAWNRRAALNAFVTETPERALEHGGGFRRAHGQGRGGRAGRFAAGDQGSVLHQRRAHHGGQPHPGQFRAAL